MKHGAKKLHKTIVTAILLLICAGVMLLPSAAFGAGGGQDVGFYVKAIIPDNQIDKTLTYFDLRMAPGGEQMLQVQVVNDSAAPMTANISAISASTSRTGVIDYRTPGVRDETLRVPFSEIARVENSVITIPAGGTGIAVIDVAMPESSYDGVVLGGILITKKNVAPETAGGETQAGMSIRNEYSYIVGVKLTMTDVIVLPDFEYPKAEAGLINYKPAVIHMIRNKEAAIVKNLHIAIDVFEKNGVTPLASLKDAVDMAPNSVMPIGTKLPSGQLGAGDYRSQVRLEWEGRVWEFEQNFSVANDEARTIRDSAVPVNTATELPAWFFILSVCAVVLLALIFILLLWRRRKKDEHEEAE